MRKRGGNRAAKPGARIRAERLDVCQAKPDRITTARGIPSNIDDWGPQRPHASGLKRSQSPQDAATASGIRRNRDQFLARPLAQLHQARSQLKPFLRGKRSDYPRYDLPFAGIGTIGLSPLSVWRTRTCLRPSTFSVVTSPSFTNRPSSANVVGGWRNNRRDIRPGWASALLLQVRSTPRTPPCIDVMPRYLTSRSLRRIIVSAPVEEYPRTHAPRPDREAILEVPLPMCLLAPSTCFSLCRLAMHPSTHEYTTT